MAVGIARRRFIAGLGGATIAWPLAARAQQVAKISRVGFLGSNLDNAPQATNYRAFLAQLGELGFSEGQNIVIDYRDFTDPRGPFVAAAEMMRSQPDLMVVTGPEVTLQAVVGASRAIPIVILAVQYDPVERGYVASLARPGGNITGVFLRQLELAAKQLEILTQAFPDRKRLAVFWDALTADQFIAAERAAKALNVQLQSLKFENPPYDVDAAFRSAAAGDAQMMLVLSSPHFTQHRSQIAELGIAHRLPAMFVFRTYVDAGGLMSYGVDFPSMFRRTADYVAKILRGGKPVDLPIEQATRFEMVVNLKTAKTIGIELPKGIELAAQYRLPAIYYFRYLASDGGLISNGPDEMDLFRRTATYVDRILKGSSPADLPVQQPTKFELVINLKTAKALGIQMPVSLLARADEVIE